MFVRWSKKECCPSMRRSFMAHKIFWPWAVPVRLMVEAVMRNKFPMRGYFSTGFAAIPIVRIKGQGKKNCMFTNNNASLLINFIRFLHWCFLFRVINEYQDTDISKLKFSLRCGRLCCSNEVLKKLCDVSQPNSFGCPALGCKDHQHLNSICKYRRTKMNLRCKK